MGTEWNLMLFVNERFSHLRNSTNKPSHLATSSKKVPSVIELIQLNNLLLPHLDSFNREDMGRGESKS